jgi:hypothetical protein
VLSAPGTFFDLATCFRVSAFSNGRNFSDRATGHLGFCTRLSFT